MKITTHNIEEGTIILDSHGKRLGLVTTIVSSAPYLSIEVLFMGTTTIETIDYNNLIYDDQYRIIPTYSLES